MVAIPQFVSPVKCGKDRLAFPVQIDWSNSLCPNPCLFDFGTQAYSREMLYVQSAWVDNSASTNDIIITVANILQKIRVYAGQVCIIPLFGLETPQVYVSNTNSGTANVGLVNIIFCNWDVSPTELVAGTDSGAGTLVFDSTVNASIQSLITDLTSTPGVLIQNSVISPLYTVKPTNASNWIVTSTALTTATVLILAAASYTQELILQNVGAAPINFIWATSSPTITAANSLVLAAGATWSAAQNNNRIPTAALYASALGSASTLVVAGH